MALADWQIKSRLALWDHSLPDDEQDPHAILIHPFWPWLVESVEVARDEIPAPIAEQYPPHPLSGPNFVELGVPSFGVGSMGYDLRLGNNFKRPKARASHEIEVVFDVLDTKPAQAEKWTSFAVKDWQPVTIKPGEMVLAETKEIIRIPKDCTLSIEGKSTNARLALTLNTTVGEPGWKGRLTLEISNIGHVPVRICPGIGICQIVFHDGAMCAVDYEKRKGKYHDAKGVQLAR